jgi:hypothetical protein
LFWCMGDAGPLTLPWRGRVDATERSGGVG